MSDTHVSLIVCRLELFLSAVATGADLPPPSRAALECAAADKHPCLRVLLYFLFA